LSKLYDKLFEKGRNLISDSFRYFLLREDKFENHLHLRNKKNRHYPNLKRLMDIETLAKERNVKREDFLIESLIEQELVQCQKSIFISEQSNIQIESKYLNLNYRNKFYVVGNTKLFPKYKTLTFNEVFARTRFRQLILLVVESGIYKQIDDSVTESKYLVRKHATKLFGGKIESYVDKVRIKGGFIQTLFFIGLSSSMFCIVVFLVEYSKFAKSFSTWFQQFKFQLHTTWVKVNETRRYNKFPIAIINCDFFQAVLLNHNVLQCYPKIREGNKFIVKLVRGMFVRLKCDCSSVRIRRWFRLVRGQVVKVSFKGQQGIPLD